MYTDVALSSEQLVLLFKSSVPALALGGVGSLPRASRFRGPHSSKKRALQAVDCSV